MKLAKHYYGRQHYLVPDLLDLVDDRVLINDDRDFAKSERGYRSPAVFFGSALRLVPARLPHESGVFRAAVLASLPALPVAAAQPAALAATGTLGGDHGPSRPGPRPAPPVASGANVGPLSGPEIPTGSGEC